jgi:biopolymer transport protein ExbD
MPKVNMPRSTPALDMTPMVDLAFLLVTFFMLTSSFRAPEPIILDTPTSTTEQQIPKQVFLVLIDEEGRAFVDITNSSVKSKVLKRMMAQFKTGGLSEEDINKFSGVGPIGLRMAEIAPYMELESTERTAYEQRGIPYDTAASKIKNSELYYWAYFTKLEAHNDYKEREEEAKLRNMEFDKTNYIQFSVKAARNAKWDKIQYIIDVFREAKVKEFQMITGLESAPES